jgi:hypothetical protein
VKLVASLIVGENEGSRYLDQCLAHLAGFCDHIVIVSDAAQPESRRFYAHEGRARQHLLEETLAFNPTHVLAIDADEFVADGPAVRRALEDDYRTTRHLWALRLQEVWKLDGDQLLIREDGGWNAQARQPVGCIWRVQPGVDYRIRNRQLACGRIPGQLAHAARFAPAVGDLLHFGWTNQRERAARHARYAEHDRGRYHARRHLDSILWPDEKITLRRRGWPTGLTAYRTRIEQRAGKEPAWQA